MSEQEQPDLGVDAVDGLSDEDKPILSQITALQSGNEVLIPFPDGDSAEADIEEIKRSLNVDESDSYFYHQTNVPGVYMSYTGRGIRFSFPSKEEIENR